MMCIKFKYVYLLCIIRSYMCVPVREEGIAISGGCFE